LRAKQTAETVKIVRSELVLEANTALTKPTGPNVEAYYRNHSKHKNAKEEQIQAEYERDLMFAAKSAIYMKKATLENLTRLAALGWFSAPISPRSFEELSDLVEKRQNQNADKKVRQASRGVKRNRRNT